MATKVARQETCTQAEDVARPSVSADEASVVSQQPGGSRRFSGTDDPFDRMLQGASNLLYAWPACAADT